MNKYKWLIVAGIAVVVGLGIFLMAKLYPLKSDKPRAQQTVTEQLEEMLDLNEAIVKTPSSVVGITADLDIEFREAVVPAHLKGSVLDENPFEFQPQIPGQAKWISTRVLRYLPDEYLPAGQSIKGTLYGKVAFGEQKNVSDFQFTFKVAEQEVLSLEGDFTAVQGQTNVVQYSGHLAFAQPIDLKEVSEAIYFTGSSGRIELEITQEQSDRIKITSEPLTRKLKAQNFELNIHEKYTADGQVWQKPIFLPGINVFRVMAHMDISTPEAVRLAYAFRFNDPIKVNTELSGYLSVDPELPFTVRAKGKRLLVEGDFVPGRQYVAKISKGFPCDFGTSLADDFSTSFSFNNMKPEVEWLSPGVYLPTDNQFKLQFKSVNVKRLKIRVTEIYPQNIGFFVQTNALIDIGEGHTDLYSSPAYSDLNRVGATIYDQYVEVGREKNKWVKTELDLSTVFQGKRNTAFVVGMDFGQNDLVGPCLNSRQNLKDDHLYYDNDDYYSNPCSYGYYYSRGYLTRLLISSNIGLTLKTADDGTHVFASNVLTARPAPGLSLNMYSYLNELLESRTTDGNGQALFSKKGAYLIARDDLGIALMKLNHPAWQINNFDVAGSSGGVNGTDVFMYADRGVHRPGDTIHLSAIVRMNRQAPPERSPVQIKVSNPKGQVVHEANTSADANGHVYFRVETELSDPTGNWRVDLAAGGQHFYKTLKVETVKPNRLKIDVDIPTKIRPVDSRLTGTIETKYLFGTPAAHLKTKIDISLSSRSFNSDKFPDYIFSSPMKRFDRRAPRVYEGNLDAQGIYHIRYQLPSLNQAPGVIQAVLNTTVYEKGGNFVAKHTPTTIYPYTAFVGLKDVFIWHRARRGETYEIPIIALNENDDPVAGHKLRVKIYLNRHYWWWHYDNRDRRDFRKMRDTHLIDEFTYTSEGGPIKHRFEVEDYGNHFIEVTDESSGHSTGLYFRTSYWGGSAQGEEQEQNYLEITSNKNVYAVGDQATVTFATPDQGMAVLTLEQGNKIIHREWTPVENEQTSFSFPITKDLIPNCYASISLIQPHNQNTNDVPMRLYGIKTLYVEEPSTRLPMTLEMPDELRPKEPFTIEITSHSAQKATYTIAVVDEGLLDLTDFSTPNPWEHYFKKLRLGVQTRDNFDEIIGVLFPDIDKYFSIGGDALAEDKRRQRLDRNEVKRFKPVVMFQEPVSIEPGETKQTTFTMPNYVGSVRVMVIGTAQHSYASLEKAVAVKQPLMILTTLPRVARPGDTFAVPVSVFAMDSSVSDVVLTLTTSPNLEPKGASEVTVAFTQPGEKDVSFLVSVGSSVGADSAMVRATSGKLKADYTVNLPVSSPNPFYTQVTDTMLTKGQELVLIPNKIGLEGTNHAKIAFSRMPDIELDKRMNYLIRYPYGCIEQTTSSVFPQLFLTNLLDLNMREKQRITENINAGIQRLTRFKIDGGFSYWPASNFTRGSYSDWGTSYAGHFLIEARTLGYHVPDDLYNHWIRTATSRAKNVKASNHRYQTYRLFLIALAGNPHIGAMNLVRENYLNSLDPLSRKLLATAYHLSGQKDVAQQLDRSTNPEWPDYRELSGTYGSRFRDRALMIYLCLKMDDLNTAARLLGDFTRSLNRGRWFSTQETAIALLSVASYYKDTPFTGGALEFTLKLGDQTEQRLDLTGYQTLVELDNMWGQEIRVKTGANNPLFVTLMEEGIPLESKIKTSHSGLELTRNYYDENGRPITVTEQLQGEAFWVVYRVRSQYATPLEELALSSIFPSGWEIINTRLTGEALPKWVRNSSADFIDIRDDRVNWFFDLGGRAGKSFAVKINPTFKGTFTLPPVVCEAMYSPEFYAHIEGGQVSVK